MLSTFKTVSYKIPIIICDECHEQILKVADGCAVSNSTEGPVSIIHKTCKDAFEKKGEFYIQTYFDLDMYIYYLVRNLEIDIKKSSHKAIMNDLEGE